MAAPRGRGSRQGALLGVVGRLALLVGLGFAAGLTIGILTDEPTLLIDHLSGEGEAVSLVDEEPIPESGDAPAPSTSTPAPTPATEESLSLPLPTVAAGPDTASPSLVHREPTPRPEPVSAVAPVSKEASAWAIQVGAFTDESAARRLVEDLRSKDYPAALVPADASKRWRVRVQPVHDESRARELAERLKRNERLPTWVIPMETGSRS